MRVISTNQWVMVIVRHRRGLSLAGLLPNTAGTKWSARHKSRSNGEGEGVGCLRRSNATDPIAPLLRPSASPPPRLAWHSSPHHLSSSPSPTNAPPTPKPHRKRNEQHARGARVRVKRAHDPRARSPPRRRRRRAPLRGFGGGVRRCARLAASSEGTREAYPQDRCPHVGR